MEDEIKLTDLISVNSLQVIQDAFCDICNISVSICDEDGVSEALEDAGFAPRLPLSEWWCVQPGY